ncbi:flagellar assembly protein FliH [Vreelandella rituensis]|uniref:Flagellar assembly protein FliH n=1 Tax=Vreelandella rituensis TaxID=2282306 RepID=A0A368TV14_9GAMM|nr:flagellar assembly protein FliH [Halomonas rituensis]RCV86983.1 flagellar assembly protein FliH [Halomonas rituensis]
MSDPRAPTFDRHGDWRRWQMDELPQPSSGFASTPQENAASQQRRKIQAAKKAAEQARQREQQERKALHDKIRQQAELDGHQEGFDRGHAEGLEQGLAEGRKQAEEELTKQLKAKLSPIKNLAEQFSTALTQLDDEIAHDLVELALATGKQLAAEALKDTPEHILTVVRELLHTEPPLTGQQRLWLNPDDHRLIDEHLGLELDAAGWKLQPDDQLPRGSCRVTSAQGELDATFEGRWQAIKAQARKRPPSTADALSSSTS